ncbi:MAG: glycosyltransferase family 4 protein [Proteobacteria bacterium]|nr:glycosyltransferase family 4 protein [Pseudomonadota bacterium]
MSTILFWDPVCVRPYDTQSIQREATGGTESTVARIADALDAFVIQHNRREANGRYLPPGRVAGVKQVVLVRDARALPQAHALYPDARHHLWVHDLIDRGSTRARRLASVRELLCALTVRIVCVSDAQRRGVQAALDAMAAGDGVVARTIHNPVDPALAPDDTPLDPDKLVFFSSPNKGLAFTLDAFRALRRRMPSLRLLVGNPGYKADRLAGIAGVEWLGALPQARIHAQLRGALCTFCPNFAIPETFGLVFAESLALGTPVLTHDCGAASEVVADPRQVLPVTTAQRAYQRAFRRLSPGLRAGPARLADRLGLFDAHVERIRAWRAGARPQVGPDPRFALANVVAQWRALFAS